MRFFAAAGVGNSICLINNDIIKDKLRSNVILLTAT